VRDASDPGQDAPGPSDGPEPLPRYATAPAETPVILDVSRDDSDVGWGDDAWRSGRGERDERDEDWYRRERPPHWE
jgi:hypothetical protein